MSVLKVFGITCSKSWVFAIGRRGTPCHSSRLPGFQRICLLAWRQGDRSFCLPSPRNGKKLRTGSRLLCPCAAGGAQAPSAVLGLGAPEVESRRLEKQDRPTSSSALAPRSLLHCGPGSVPRAACPSRCFRWFAVVLIHERAGCMCGRSPEVVLPFFFFNEFLVKI